MTDENAVDIKYARPASIILISLWLLFGAFTTVWIIFRGTATSSTVTTALLAVGGTISLICGIGFWFMKKWALYLYGAYGLINQVALLVLGRWNIFSLFVFVIIIYFGYRNLSKMS